MTPTPDEPRQARIRVGEQLRDSGALDEALRLFTDIADEFPLLALAHYKCGTVLALLDRLNEAESAYRLALRLQPIYPEAANNLGVLLGARRDWVEAETLFYHALAETPDYFQPHLNIADVLHKMGRPEQALFHARRAFELGPTSTMAIERIGVILRTLGRPAESASFLSKYISSETTDAALWSTFAVTLQELGRHAEAELAHTEADRFAGKEYSPRVNRLFFSNYLPLPADELWQRHRAFGEWARETVGLPTNEFPAIAPEPDRRLRVGVVSGDLRKHSVAYFVPGMLGLLDRLQFQLFAYNVSHHIDDVTRKLKPLFNVWRDVASLNHKELFQRIFQDRIDILIDLSGYTNENRLMVFARRPAPVQISYLGYPNTTGLDTIDYRLTDALADPVGQGDVFYAEELWRLNRSFLCYTPSETAPNVALGSAASDGVVFGSFNSRAKYSDECLAAWGRLLLNVPGSRLIIKSSVGIVDDAGRNELVARFVAQGLAPERIEVMGRIAETRDHLDCYSKIDIALDTFPYNGTTTTCEALWMGVPVITLAGNRHAARVGSSLLATLDLSEYVATSVDEYIQMATSLANNPVKRQELRATMRNRMRASKLCDARDMGRELGRALREMWHRYCAAESVGTHRVQAEDREGTANEMIEKMRLHIGGTSTKEGWKILNVEPGDGVDFVADIRNLSGFEDNCCSDIYASHVLEHLGQAEVLPVFNELYRMLDSGGRLYISVPDMDILAWLFLSPTLDAAGKFNVMRMMFGGQTSPHDFHQIGFNFDFLVDYLRDVGFESVEHVESLGIFNDTSNTVFDGRRISLNLIVTK